MLGYCEVKLFASYSAFFSLCQLTWTCSDETTSTVYGNMTSMFSMKTDLENVVQNFTPKPIRDLMKFIRNASFESLTKRNGYLAFKY